MGFTKIENTDLVDIGVIGLPDTPGLSTSAMQAKLEETARSVIIPKHNELIDELEASTSALSLGATPVTGRSSSPNVQDVMEKLSVDLKTVEDGMAEAIAESHSHPNKAILDDISEDPTTHEFLYQGASVGKTEYDDLGNLPQINSVTLIGNKSASDLGLVAPTDLGAVATSNDYNDLDNQPTIPTKTSDLTNDSNFATTSDVATAVAAKSNVAWNQQITTGQKIAVVTIDGTPTDVYAPTGGGGGGGGAVDSVNGQTGTVVLEINDIDDVSITSVATNDVLIRDASGWKNGQLADVAYTNDYGDLSNTPTNVSDFTNDSGYQTASDVATAISGKEDKSALGDLAYIDKDGVGSVKFLQGDGTWQNPPAGGHTMIANNTAIATMKTNSQDPTDDKVASTYAISNWSNAEIVTLYTTIAQDTDTVGTWTDTWKTDGVRTGWLWHSLLHDILSDDEVEIELAFDVSGEEVVSLYAYRVDDDVQNNGVDGGAIAIKLNGAIQNASGVKVAINLKRQRTQTDNLTVLS